MGYDLRVVGIRLLPFFLAALLVPAGWATPVSAESKKSPDKTEAEDDGVRPQQQPPGYGAVEAGRDFFADQRMIWSKPFSLEGKDAKWLIPLGGSAAALIPLDRRISSAFEDPGFRRPSKAVSSLGGPAAFAAAGAFYGIGKLAHKERFAETGLLGMRAVGNAYLVVAAVKEATNRQRPYQGDGDGSFWEGGRSFPSGHAAETWALATVLAHRYPDKKWVKIASYGVAAGVTASRLTGRNHHASDLVIGSAIGFLIGRYVVKNHDRRIPRLDRP